MPALPSGTSGGVAVAPAEAGAALRVTIGEDDVLLREGIARILTDAGLDVVGRSGDADDLLRRTLAYRPDVVIADVQMPPRGQDDGLQAALELRRRRPDIGVLILSQFCEPAYVMELVGEHPEGIGYLLKERVGDVAAFVDAVTRVAAGGSALDPEVVARMIGRHTPTDPLRVLTDRELAVLAAMAEGRSNLGIAQSLLVGHASVEKHVTAIFRKLRIAPADTEHRRVQAVLTYLRHRHQHR
jgi:DNA-binding NarL/FixJ family response regulator